MNGPEPFNLPVHVHDQKSVTPDCVLEMFRKPCHIVVGIDDDELNLIESKGEVVRNPPLSLVGVVDGLPVEELLPAQAGGSVRWPERCHESPKMRLPLLFRPVVCTDVIDRATASGKNTRLGEADAE